MENTKLQENRKAACYRMLKCFKKHDSHQAHCMNDSTFNNDGKHLKDENGSFVFRYYKRINRRHTTQESLLQEYDNYGFFI